MLSTNHRLRAGDNPLQAEMRRIVESIYGPAVRRLPGLEIGRAYLNATNEEFRYGGDLVDVFHYGNGLTSVAMVDITGHGIHAAMYAGLAKHALRAYASRGFNARDSVRALNRLCIENSLFEADDEFFATVFFGIVDAERRTMQYVSAGHEAAYIVASDGATMLAATGPIIGLFDDDSAFDHGVARLSNGSILAAVTDGFSEARNARLEFLGAEALVDVVDRHRACEAEQQAEALTRYAYEYANEQLHDDVAALVVKVQTGRAA
ncbi:MAG TPA: PP2C family protein-serine/threonine phosphatase [Candidatus Elarobacter sp.]|nr:PP2C family protein-serine/threonine phosphatase [Candidatus Elarobacter sp.]